MISNKIRPFYLPIIALILLTSCKSYVQVYETKAVNSVLQNECFVYENDSLKITYTFWAQNGVLAFAVYNKLDKPIYLDWKKSAYINNSVKLNYWNDESQTNTISYGNFSYNGPSVKPGQIAGNNNNLSTTNTIKLERITFIPPKSNFFKSQFKILPFPIKLDINTAYSEENLYNDNKIKTKVFTINYTKENTPLAFRNYLTFSYSEDFKAEFYVDNEFYIESIKEMNTLHFEKTTIDKNMNESKSYPYKKLNSFYLNIPNEATVDYRKK
jgi:hypothetical protein